MDFQNSYRFKVGTISIPTLCTDLQLQDADKSCFFIMIFPKTLVMYYLDLQPVKEAGESYFYT